MTTSTRHLVPGAIAATPEMTTKREVTLTSIGSTWNWTTETRVVSTADRDDASTRRSSSGVQTVTRTFAHFGPMYPLTEGATTEYRAEIVVTGLEGGAITAATVWLPGIRQVFPEGLDLLLIGPSGHDELCVSAGDVQDTSARFDLALTDTPARTPLDHGSPSDVTVGPAFSNETTGFAASALAPSGQTSLAVLTSTVPNGLWQLRLFADVPTNRVHFGGWNLTITAQVPV